MKWTRAKKELVEWFNILVLHKNRVNGVNNNCIKEKILPDFLNMLLWRFEYECLIQPQHNETQGLYVIQPGMYEQKCFVITPKLY